MGLLTILRAIAQWVRQAGSANESKTSRDGLFSWSGEVHGFVVGMYYGFIDFADWGGLPTGYAEGKDIEKGWYPKTGYVVGALIRVSAYLLVGAVFGPEMLV